MTSPTTTECELRQAQIEIGSLKVMLDATRARAADTSQRAIQLEYLVASCLGLLERYDPRDPEWDTMRRECIEDIRAKVNLPR